MRAFARFFDGDSPLARDPVLGEYLGDLVRPYGVGLRTELLAAGIGHSYGEMGEQLIRDSVADGQEVDLLVLAHAVPDVRPGRSTALYLSALCHGRPQAFAISEQGAAAAFTASRLAGEFLRGGDCRDALVLVLEQSVLHYDLLPDDGSESLPALPDRHAGVAIRYDQPFKVWQYSDIDAASAVTRFLDLFPEASSALDDRVFVLGAGLAGVPDSRLAGDVIRPHGQPMTGTWAALAEKEVSERRSIVLADHDPWSRTLNVWIAERTAATWTP